MMSEELVNINPIDFKELKKNLFPLMKLLKKINEGKKKGLNSSENINSIKSKIEYISNNSEILLNKKFKFLYASLCLLQIQNNSYLNELKNSHNKKRLRNVDEEEKSNEEITEITNKTKKRRVDANDNVIDIENENNRKDINEINKNAKKQKGKKKEVEIISEEEILENIKLRNVNKKNKKKNINPEVKNIKHLIDVMEFVKYCKQKPFSKNAIFPVLPLKTSEEDELSLFSRLENITDEKMEDIINSYASKNKDFYNKCWDDVQKIKEDNEEEEEEEEVSKEEIIEQQKNNNGQIVEEIIEENNLNDNNKKHLNKEKESKKKKGKEKEKENEMNNLLEIVSSSDEEKDEDLNDEYKYTDFIPNQVYRSRIWTDGIMDRFNNLLEEKKNEKAVKPRRIKVCTECINRYHNRLYYIPCTGTNPCERCKRLGLICYYPFTKKQTSIKRYGNIYRLKENANNPLTNQEYNERYEMEEKVHNLNSYEHIEFRNKAYKKLINDSHIIGDGEDYLQYKQNFKLGYYIKNTQKDKTVINYLKPFIQDDKKQQEEEQKEIEENGKIPFLGKTNPRLPTTELLDALQYSISKRSSLEKQTDSMSFRYDSSALIALGILYEEIIKYEVEKFNKPDYYQ